MRPTLALLGLCAVLSFVTGVSLASTAGVEHYHFAWERRLAWANQMYDGGDWLHALSLYREVRAEHADLAIDDEICFRIARCSESALRSLDGILPAVLSAHYQYGSKVMDWLRDAYGYHVEESEGDARWVYDKRALRELLRLHPGSSYADDADYVLVKYDLIKYDPMGIQQTWPEAVRRYERLLERYPDTNLRGTILEELAFLKDPNGEHPERVRDYWHSVRIDYSGVH